MFLEIRVVVEAGDLQPSQGQLARVERFRTVGAQALKFYDLQGSHSGHGLGRRIQRAEIDCLPEGEVVRMENAAPPIRKNLVAKYLEQGGLNIALKVVGFGQAGLWCLLARALAEDDAEFCIDANQFDGASDEAYLASLNIPLIRRAGDLRTASIMNPRAPLWIQNAGSGFPMEWTQSVYQVLGKPGALRIEREPASEEALLGWLLQGLSRVK